MKSFDDWFSEQGSSPETPAKSLDDPTLPQGTYKAEIEGFKQEGNQLTMEVKVLKRPGKADVLIPVKLPVEVPDFKWETYEEQWHNGIRWIRIGDKIRWTDVMGHHELSVDTINRMAKDWPHIYPEFKL